MSTGVVRRSRRAPRRIDVAQRSRRELRDVRHSSRPDLRVEWILVCPSGIHVVTALPAGLGREGELVGSGPMSVSRAAADVVAALLPLRYRGRVRPVLCRVDDVAMADQVDDVLVTSASTLEHIVCSSPAVLSTSEVHDVALRLDARLEPFPVAREQKRRPWYRRVRLLLGLLAAASATGAVVVTREVGSVPLPW